MKNSVNKGFLNYLLLFVVVIVAAVLVAGTIMMFSNVAILGYVFVGDNSKTTINTYDGVDQAVTGKAETKVLNPSGNVVAGVVNSGNTINYSTLNNLIIETDGMPIEFARSKENAQIDVIRSLKGFTKEDAFKEPVITKQYISSTKTFKITVTHGDVALAIGNDSIVRVYIKNLTDNLNIVAKTGKGAITFGKGRFDKNSEYELSALTLDFKTGNGKILIGEKAKVTGSIKFDVEKKGSITIEGDLKRTTANPLSSAILAVKEGDIKTANLLASSLSLKGEMVFLNMGDIRANISLEIKSGDFKAVDIYGNLTDPSESASSVTITVNNISGDVTLPKMSSGDFTANKVSGILTITTNSGNIKVKEVSRATTIKTTSGSVSLFVKGSSLGNVNITTTTGSISLVMDNIPTETNLTSEKGKIKFIYNLSHTNFTIDITAKKAEFGVLNQTRENAKNLMGYPSIASPAPGMPHLKNVKIKTGGNVYISYEPTPDWELIA